MPPIAAPRLSPAVLTALITVQVLFGVNYVLSKIVVTAMPPMVWASFRAIVSALGLFLIARLSGRTSPRLNRDFLLPLFGYALLGVVINQSCFLVGIRYTTATNGAILTSLIPVFTLLFVSLAGHEPLTIPKILGFISALAGVLILRRVEELSLSDQTLLGDSLMVINCMSYALFLTLGRKFLMKHDPLWTTAWLFLYGSLGITAVSLPYWGGFHWPEMTSELVGSMIFGILGATLLTYLLNTWALARAKSSAVALFIYLQPVVASTLAWYYFDETITPRTIGSCVLIFLGVMLGTQIAGKPLRKRKAH